MYRRPVGPIASTALLAAILIAAWTYSPETTPASGSVAKLQQCEARFEPPAIDAGTVREVRVILSEPLDDINEAETPDDSGLTVIWLHDAEPEPARVRVSALSAEPGEWTVTLRSPNGGCAGVITVLDGED